MKIDVAVVGAGPAGACTAYRLANAGARVALFDHSHPREKPCGGGITGRALALVADVVQPDLLPAVRVRVARFVDSDAGRSATVALARHGNQSRQPLVVASRRDFDARLLLAAQEAGAHLYDVRVVDLTRTPSGFALTTADRQVHHAGCIVGADGANSMVRRRLATPFRRDQLSIATGFFAHGATSDEIIVEIVANPPGYIWSFPRPDHLAIGICAAADAGRTASSLRARTASWIRATGIGANACREPYSWPIPSLSAADWETTETGGDGWCLVGDAAGLVDPITREGIYFALESAQFAADAIVEGAAQRNRRYTDRVRTEIVAELARAARFKDGFFRPAFTRLMIEALRHSEQIRSVMADLIAGTQGYRGLKWRLARTMEIGFAWKALTASL